MSEWETSVSSSGEKSVVRDVDREEVMEMNFSDAIWLTLKGDKPNKDESELFSTILSSSIDHGIGNPSTVSARTVQSGGNSMNASVAAGVLALGDKHGGAIEDAMKMLQSDRSPEEIVRQKVEDDEMIPGLGHKIYDEEDPRASKIFSKADELEISGTAVQKLNKIGNKFAELKVDLVTNVDGAIAAVMTDMDWDWRLGKGIFIVARTPGLVAHVREEMKEDDFRRQEGSYSSND